MRPLRSLPPRWSPLCLSFCGIFTLAAASVVANELRSGPMLGYSEIADTIVWLQTTGPADLQLRYWVEGEETAAHLTGSVSTSREADYIARFPLSELRFGTDYAYEIYLDGEVVPLPYPARFHTQPMWRWRRDPPTVKFAVGSCNYVNETDFDRPGSPYGKQYEIFRSILATRPQAMIWLGDNVYYREADWPSEAGMRRRYAATRELPELQPLLASVHHYAIWDDHDFGPDNSDRTFRGRPETLRVFADYWANPSYGLPEAAGVFFRFDWSDVEIFLLDDRYDRAPNALPDGPAKRMLGAVQRRWLEEALTNSNATFKIIADGGRLLAQGGSGEGLFQFPTEQQSLLRFFEDSRIPGIVLLSGDRHQTELVRLDRPSSYPLYELVVSPLTAGVRSEDEAPIGPVRVPGTSLLTERNFATLTFEGAPEQRSLLIEAIASDGTVRWRYRIAASELRHAE